MKEIRIHGRGGMGTVITSEILANAFLYDGIWAVCFPLFGAERRGAPVTAFLRFDNKPVRIKTKVYHPHLVMVLDPNMSQEPSVYSGLKAPGVVILNHHLTFSSDFPHQVSKVGFIDATNIALKIIKRPIPNSCLLGAFAAVTNWVSLDGVMKAISSFFSDADAKLNRSCAKAGFENVKVVKVQ